MKIVLLFIIFAIVSIQIYRRYLSNSTLILIEGLDCSGKKTLSKELMNKLSDEYDVKINIGNLLKTPIGKLSDKYTYNWKLPNEIRSIIYAISFLIDGLLFIPKNNQIIFQISYFPRHYTYNIIMRKKILTILHLIFSNLYVKFDYAIYLHTDYQVRINRHKEIFKKKKEIQSIRSRFMIENSTDYLKWDQELHKYIHRNFKMYSDFDTTNLAPIDIIKKIDLSFIKK